MPADGVEVLLRAGDHDLFGQGRLHRAQLVADAGGGLVVLLLRLRRHLLAQRLRRAVGVALDEGHQAAQQLVVLLGGHLAGAGRAALADVEQQAGALGPRVAVEHPLGAGADRVDPQQQVEGLADGVGVGIGPEVAGAVVAGVAAHHRPRHLLAQRDGEVGVGLVVGVPDVEARPVLLDQVELEVQRFDV